ncbi:MAG: T9SS type A sorting domain-containing protein [Flavobacteriaceae bacterium]|nr:T9SS type A sorting domain-containing protein [Flavobacteriaceae bacterium]
MKEKLFILTKVVLILCFSIGAKAQTAGTLTFSFNQPQPTSPAPNAGIKSILAVWIENNSGIFVKTKMRFVGTSTKDHLPTWAVKAGGTLSNATATTCNTTDGTTGATRTATTTPVAFGSRSITWDGKNVVGATNGTTVADGIYRIWIESTWVDSGSNNHNELVSFSFTKGPTNVHLTPAGDTYINTVVLDWVAAPLGVDEVKNQEPAVVIYPVPSSGIFNLDLKNELNDIKVFDLLGQIVYNEGNLKNTFETTKKIDLSNLNNGNYIISLTNENGTSNYEVIISK